MILGFNKKTEQKIKRNGRFTNVVRSLIAFSFVLFISLAQAQLNYSFTEGKFLIKGKVTDIESKAPLPYANIRINGTNKGITCDADGMFSFYVYMHDTLRFSSTGYLNKVLHVYDLDSSQYYTLNIQLIHDFIKLKEVTIYPFHDLDEFKKAFVEGKGIDRISIAGIDAPKYGTKVPKAKFNNPVSFLYERLKRKRSSADPDFRP